MTTGSTTSQEVSRLRHRRSLLVLACAAVFVLTLDQLTKWWAVATLPPGEPVPVLGEFLQWLFVRNPGAAFSLASGATWIFTLIALGVGVAIVWFAKRIASLSWALFLGLLLGGTLGNLTDRLFRSPGFPSGHVVDFISTPWMMPAIYNIADIAIVTCMGLFIIITLRGIGIDGVRQVRGNKNASTETAHSPTDEHA